MGILASAGPAPLPGFLNSLAGPLDHYGYWAIALLLLLENIGIPVVPGEFAMIGGAIFAGTGRAGLNVVVVAIVAFAASVAGAEIGYLIGRFAGRELILHFGKYVLIKPHHLDRAEKIVDRYGGIVVVIARFIVGLREAIGIIAGITEMRWITFTVYNVIGAAAWVATWVTIGDLAGGHIGTIYKDVNRFSLYVFIALAVLLAAYILWRVVRRRRSAGPDTDEAADVGKADDTGEAADVGKADDTGEAADAGKADDTGEAADAGKADDTGEAADTGEADDTGEAADTGEADDTGEAADTGEAEAVRPRGGQGS